SPLLFKRNAGLGRKKLITIYAGNQLVSFSAPGVSDPPVLFPAARWSRRLPGRGCTAWSDLCRHTDKFVLWEDRSHPLHILLKPYPRHHRWRTSPPGFPFERGRGIHLTRVHNSH